jgi:nitroreductase
MTMKELVLRNRSYRRFREDVVIERDTLRELVDLARLSPCARNDQALKFVISCTREKNDLIFPHLGWAGFIEDWPGPSEGERPAAYIILLGDREIRDNFGRDVGIACQSIMLGATERGLGGCIIGSVKREKIKDALHIPQRYEILLVLALGKPNEKVVIEPLRRTGDTKYWRDADGIHHVPKRDLDELILDL